MVDDKLAEHFTNEQIYEALRAAPPTEVRANQKHASSADVIARLKALYR